MSGNNIRQLLTGIKPVPSIQKTYFQSNFNRRAENSSYSSGKTSNKILIFFKIQSKTFFVHPHIALFLAYYTSQEDIFMPEIKEEKMEMPNFESDSKVSNDTSKEINDEGDEEFFIEKVVGKDHAEFIIERI